MTKKKLGIKSQENRSKIMKKTMTLVAVRVLIAFDWLWDLPQGLVKCPSGCVWVVLEVWLWGRVYVWPQAPFSLMLFCFCLLVAMSYACLLRQPLCCEVSSLEPAQWGLNTLKLWAKVSLSLKLLVSGIVSVVGTYISYNSFYLL